MLAAAIQLLVFGLAATAQVNEEPFPAHRVVGNVYYVGSKNVAIYLVATDEGHILINSGYEETVPLIRLGVESLGFKMKDVKYLLASHAHSDHVAGHALLQEMTGAEVAVMTGDVDVVASGGKGQYLYDSRWRPCRVNRVLKDGDEIKLGGETLIARRTPGHTRGCTTWAWQAASGEKKVNVVVVGSPNVNPGYRLVGNQDYTRIVKDFESAFSIWQRLPCDVFLGAHGAYYGMAEKFERRQEGKEDETFVDPEGYKKYIAMKAQTFRGTLVRQRAETRKRKTKRSKTKR